MNEPAMPLSPDAQTPVGHETTDASPYYVGLFALGLTLMIALVLFFLDWMFWRLETAARQADPPQSPLMAKQTPPSPPVLQDNPGADLAGFRREEELRLSSYGWTDARKRAVRIPVARAIEILAERGLPEPKGSPEPARSREQPP